MSATLTPCLRSKTEGPGGPMKVKGTMEQAMKAVPPLAALEPNGNAESAEFLAMAASGEETSEANLAELLRHHMQSPHMENHA